MPRSWTISRGGAAPRAALWLGAASAAPLVLGAAAAVIGPDWVRATAFFHATNFAALALAAPGAALWGFAAAAGARGGWYLAGAAPVAIAWVALAAVHPTLRTLLLIGGFAAAFAIDARAARAGLAPPWYMGLRKPLSAVAIGALGVIAIAAR